jgi:hypothetical protein
MVDGPRDQQMTSLATKSRRLLHSGRSAILRVRLADGIEALGELSRGGGCARCCWAGGSTGQPYRCRQFLRHRLKQAIGCSPSGGREAADDTGHVPLLHGNRFRCRVTPDNGSRSRIQHVRRLRTTLVDGYALEQRLGPETVLQVLRDSLAWIHCPTMEFVEPDLFRTWTIDDAAFAEVFRASEFLDVDWA